MWLLFKGSVYLKKYDSYCLSGEYIPSIKNFPSEFCFSEFKQATKWMKKQRSTISTLKFSSFMLSLNYETSEEIQN